MIDDKEELKTLINEAVEKMSGEIRNALSSKSKGIQSVPAHRIGVAVGTFKKEMGALFEEPEKPDT